MKRFRILIGALALAMVAATVIACTKEINDESPQQNAEIFENQFLNLNGIHVKV